MTLTCRKNLYVKITLIGLTILLMLTYNLIQNDFSIFNVCYCDNDLPSYTCSFKFNYDRLKGVTPVYHFDNIKYLPETIRCLKRDSGVYLWYNKVNGSFYVGSSGDLQTRLLDYNKPSYINSDKNIKVLNYFKKYPIIYWDLLILELVMLTGNKKNRIKLLFSLLNKNGLIFLNRI